MFQSANKAKAKAIAVDRRRTGGGPIAEDSTFMTVSGAVNKTLILGVIMLLTSFIAYAYPHPYFRIGGALGATAIYFITSMKPHMAPTLAPLYALVKGLFIGAISAHFASSYGGIVFQAAGLTVATLLAMLMIYQSGIIKVTKKFRMIVGMSVGAIMMMYLISWIGFFVGFTVPYIHDNGPIGIGISVVILVVASLYLLMNFDNFDKGEANQAPKYMEWYYGMAMLFAVLWLYVEFLRILSKLQSD